MSPQQAAVLALELLEGREPDRARLVVFGCWCKMCVAAEVPPADFLFNHRECEGCGSVWTVRHNRSIVLTRPTGSAEYMWQPAQLYEVPQDRLSPEEIDGYKRWYERHRARFAGGGS